MGRCVLGKKKAGEVGSSAFEVCFVLRAGYTFLRAEEAAKPVVAAVEVSPFLVPMR